MLLPLLKCGVNGMFIGRRRRITVLLDFGYGGKDSGVQSENGPEGAEGKWIVFHVHLLGFETI